MIPWISVPSPNFAPSPPVKNSTYTNGIPNQQMYYVVLADDSQIHGTPLSSQYIVPQMATTQSTFPAHQSPIMFLVNGSSQGMLPGAPNPAYMGVPTLLPPNIGQPNMMMTNHHPLQNGSLNIPRQEFALPTNFMANFPGYSSLPQEKSLYQQPFNIIAGNHGKAPISTSAQMTNPTAQAAVRPNKVKKDSGLSLTCFYCNGVGHKAIHCPKNPDWSGELSALCVVHNKTRCMSSLRKDEDGNYSCIQQSACRRVTNSFKFGEMTQGQAENNKQHWVELKTADPLEASLCEMPNMVNNAHKNHIASSSNIFASRQDANHVDDSIVELMRSLCIPSNKNDSSIDTKSVTNHSECLSASHLNSSLSLSNTGILPSQVTMETGSMLHLSGLSLDLNN